MSETTKTDYVLGTNADELQRLGQQHEVWRAITMDCWRRAGISTGSHVIDVGSGPGYATFDLSKLVGPDGKVTALERSENFARHLSHQLSERKVTNVDLHQVDLVEDPLPVQGADVAWCRWVCIFLKDPEALVQKLKTALRPGGRVVFFEYMNYQSWRMIPEETMVTEFVQRIVNSWNAVQGNANVAINMVDYLRRQGFQIQEARPHIFTPKPQDPFFGWLTSFMRVNTARSLDLKEITPAWATEFLKHIEAAEHDQNRLMVTPTVLEIIAIRP